MTNDDDDFDARNVQVIAGMRGDAELEEATRRWFTAASRHEYSYHFRWLGLPIIQFPQDIAAMQEIIWRIRPELIVETGVARGGSLIFYASMLELLGGGGRVVGIDIDIRRPNREAIEAHPMFRRITLLEGSSTDEAIVTQVRALARSRRPVLVVLDSNHTHAHVAAELRAYAPLVTAGSYLVVFDTVIEQMPEDFYPDRPWKRDDNAATAVLEFLRGNDRFAVDAELETKLQITVAPGGYLRCLSD
jgi:cephalosporin hydroxylase